MRNSFLVFFLFLPCAFFGQIIETFYGPIDIEEPVILELIESEPFQRLKDVRQYGVSYYTTFRDPYNRYDHSMGVFAILRWKGASLEEQIAGLLHDVSHTVFSHVGDWVFDQIEQKHSYQDNIHSEFLEKYGLSKILAKHGFEVEDILHKSGGFSLLECDLPDLCADRIDYNLQGAYYQGFLTKKEIKRLLEDLHFDGEKWVSTRPHLMKKMVAFSLYMTRNCWGSPENYVTSDFLAKALQGALSIGKISENDIFYGKDDEVFAKLSAITSPAVKQWMKRLKHFENHFSLTSKDRADIHAKLKFRGVNPWIQKGKRCKRLTEIDRSLGKEYERVKAEMAEGWPISLH